MAYYYNHHPKQKGRENLDKRGNLFIIIKLTKLMYVDSFLQTFLGIHHLAT